MLRNFARRVAAPVRAGGRLRPFHAAPIVRMDENYYPQVGPVDAPSPQPGEECVQGTAWTIRIAFVCIEPL